MGVSCGDFGFWILDFGFWIGGWGFTALSLVGIAAAAMLPLIAMPGNRARHTRYMIPIFLILLLRNIMHSDGSLTHLSAKN